MLGRKLLERFVDFERDLWGNKGVSLLCVLLFISCYWIFLFKLEKVIVSSFLVECFLLLF